eukprot:279030-Rhodomonas_salina.1
MGLRLSMSGQPRNEAELYWDTGETPLDGECCIRLAAPSLNPSSKALLRVLRYISRFPAPPQAQAAQFRKHIEPAQILRAVCLESGRRECEEGKGKRRDMLPQDPERFLKERNFSGQLKLCFSCHSEVVSSLRIGLEPVRPICNDANCPMRTTALCVTWTDNVDLVLSALQFLQNSNFQ